MGGDRLECWPIPVSRNTCRSNSIKSYPSTRHTNDECIPFWFSFWEDFRINTPADSPPKQSERTLFCRFRFLINHSWYLFRHIGHPRTNGNEMLSVNCNVFGCNRSSVGEWGSQNISPHLRQWCLLWKIMNFKWHVGRVHSLAAVSGYTWVKTQTLITADYLPMIPFNRRNFLETKRVSSRKRLRWLRMVGAS